MMEIADAIAELKRLCRERQLPPPSVSTIRRRLKAAIVMTTTLETPKNATVSHARPRNGRVTETTTNLLSLLYESVGKAEGWNTFIDALACSYRGGTGVLLVHDLSVRNGFVQAAGPWEPDQVSKYNQYYASTNPWLPHLNKRPAGVAVPAEFMLPRAALLRTEFYCDYLRPVHLDSGVGITVQKDGSRHMVVSVLFPQLTAETDDDTIGRLQRLAPHLLRVAQLNRQLAGLEARAAAAEAVLDGLVTAMYAVLTSDLTKRGGKSRPSCTL